ncbi:MAG TPA: chemotaxis protein CheW [Vicinamibacteria bacterium]|nr:chemotaxis protein CheW [Vicinamibacteria bacterium]
MSVYSPEAERRILEQRTRTLSQPLARTAAGETTGILVFARGGDRFGVEAVRVEEALPPASLTALPGARPFLAGVIPHRGRILGVFDLARLLGLAQAEAPSRPGAATPVRVVVVQARGMTFGLQADEVSGVVQVDAREAAPARSETSARRQPWLRATTADMVTILDLDALAQDPRLTVNEE